MGSHNKPIRQALEEVNFSNTVTDWLQSHVDYDMRVIFCCFDARTEQAYQTKME